MTNVNQAMSSLLRAETRLKRFSEEVSGSRYAELQEILGDLAEAKCAVESVVRQGPGGPLQNPRLFVPSPVHQEVSPRANSPKSAPSGRRRR